MNSLLNQTLLEQVAFFSELGINLNCFRICPTAVIKDIFDTLAPNLTQEEKAILSKYKIDEGKIDFLSGRFLLKDCIIEYYKNINAVLDYLDISILKTENGEPLIYINNIQCENITASISHKKEYVFTAINVNSPIGIDVELISPQIIKVKSQFLFPDEEAIIQQYICDNTQLLTYYTMVWSSKEAIAKYLRKGLYHVFSNVKLYGIVENEFQFRHENTLLKTNCFHYDKHVFSYIV